MNSILFEKARITAEKLAASGYEAYFVGGCVRDMLMGRECHDIDITTDALPEEIISVFSGEKMILTGMKHGTVTVVTDGIPFEITTYRIDGEYSDFRHPEKVEFVADLAEDLKRRDFTLANLLQTQSYYELPLFEDVEDVAIPRPVREFAPIHFRRVYQDE